MKIEYLNDFNFINCLQLRADDNLSNLTEISSM